MCGIFGSPTITPSVRAMLPYLGIEMQTRGKDAWGASDGLDVIKRAGPIVDTWAELNATVQDWPSGIFHTRGASVGTPKLEENAHPFVYAKEDGSQVIGIHNGFVTNHVELDNKYTRKYDVDSQHIWAHRAAGLSWSEIRGWGNLAWFESNAEGVQRMNLARFNSDGLKLARLKGGEFVFCSESKPLATIAQMLGNPAEVWYPIEEYRHYWFAEDAGEICLFKGMTLPFAKPTVTPTPNQGHVTYSGFDGRDGRRPWHSNPYCFECNSMRTGGEDELLCFSCLRVLVDDYMKADEEMWKV